MIAITKRVLPIIAATALFSFTQKADPANLGGQWKLNESKSELGEFGGRMAAKSIKIDQRADGVTITRNVTTFQGEETTRTENLTFDGKEVESAGGFGNAVRKSSAKWSADQKQLIVSYSISFGDNEFKGTETFSLSADGKTLTIQTTSAGPQGDNTTKAVYDKQ